MYVCMSWKAQFQVAFQMVGELLCIWSNLPLSKHLDIATVLKAVHLILVANIFLFLYCAVGTGGLHVLESQVLDILSKKKFYLRNVSF